MENFVYFSMGVAFLALATILVVIAYKEFKDYM